MKARPYQNQCVSSVLDAYRAGHKSVLATLATGLGKTVIFSVVASKCVQKGKRVMVVAHREELITQAADKLRRITGAAVDIEMAEQKALETLHGKAPIVVASVQTLNAKRGDGKRMKFFRPEEFGLLVFDECHHATATSYVSVIKHFRDANPEVKIMGVTATADRGDGEALRKVFEVCAFEYGVADGIRDGWLVDVEQQTVRIDSLSFSDVRTTAGDLNAADLAAVMEYEKNLHGIADATLSIVDTRRTLVFAASVAQAERLVEIFNRHRPGSARVVTGATPKDVRRDMLRAYAAKEFQFLVNVGVATEGFDDPGIEVVVMARPTKSRALYAQMLGRGTRPLPGIIDGEHTEAWEATQRCEAIKASGKPSVLVLDFAGNAGRHKLVSARDVLGGSMDEKVAKRVAKKQEKSGRPSSVLDDIAQAEQEERKEAQAREARKREKLTARASYSTDRVSPFDTLGVSAPQEMSGDLGRQPSSKMVEFLRRQGIENAEMLSWRAAHKLIGTINDRFKRGLCSFKQSRFLKKYGYETENMTRVNASALFEAIKANGWKPLNEEAAV